MVESSHLHQDLHTYFQDLRDCGSFQNCMVPRLTNLTTTLAKQDRWIWWPILLRSLQAEFYGVPVQEARSSSSDISSTLVAQRKGSLNQSN
jgi:hypothetical protein